MNVSKLTSLSINAKYLLIPLYSVQEPNSLFVIAVLMEILVVLQLKKFSVTRALVSPSSCSVIGPLTEVESSRSRELFLRDNSEMIQHDYCISSSNGQRGKRLNVERVGAVCYTRADH